jgi:arsenite-transporting ATPase
MAYADGYGTLAIGFGVVLLGQRRLVFFGGKGGVGKTTMASATGFALAKRGQKVLVVSTDPAHSLGHLWDKKIGDEVTYVYEDRLAGLEIDPERTARHHFAEVADVVRQMMPEHLHGEVRKYFRQAIDSPGAHEAAMLERIAKLSLETSDEWDTVIFDTAPTGHTIRLLEMPQVLTVWAEGMMGRAKKTAQFHEALEALPGGTKVSETGPVAQRNARIRKILDRRSALFASFHRMLTSKSVTGFVIVTLAERMPVAETLELKERLTEAKIPIAGIIVNRRSPTSAGKMLAKRRQIEDEYLGQLRAKSKKIPLVEVELQERELTGRVAIERLADQISEHIR